MFNMNFISNLNVMSILNMFHQNKILNVKQQNRKPDQYIEIAEDEIS